MWGLKGSSLGFQLLLSCMHPFLNQTFTYLHESLEPIKLVLASLVNNVNLLFTSTWNVMFWLKKRKLNSICFRVSFWQGQFWIKSRGNLKHWMLIWKQLVNHKTAIFIYQQSDPAADSREAHDSTPGGVLHLKPEAFPPAGCLKECRDKPL